MRAGVVGGAVAPLVLGAEDDGCGAPGTVKKVELDDGCALLVPFMPEPDAVAFADVLGRAVEAGAGVR